MFPAPLFDQARISAAAAVALVLNDARNPDLAVLHTSTLEQLGHQRTRAKLVERSGLQNDALPRVASVMTDALEAERRATTGTFEHQVDQAIAHLRVTRECRRLASERFVTRNDIWPVLTEGLRATQLIHSALALEVLVRQLVRSCHQSEDALRQYLRKVHGRNIRLDGLSQEQLHSLLFDEVHTARLHPLLLQPDLLGLRGTAAETLEMFLADTRLIRNEAAHVREISLGEESLHLFACEAGKIERLVQRAVDTGMLRLPSPPKPLNLSLLYAPTSEIETIDVSAGANWLPLSKDRAEVLADMQSRLAARVAGASVSQAIRLDTAGVPFRLIPNPSAGWFRMTESLVARGNGATLVDAGQLQHLMKRLCKPPASARLPTAAELRWALAPYGQRADTNPFGLRDPSLDDAHWVEHVPGQYLLVSLPDALPDLRTTGRVRLLIASERAADTASPP